MSSDQSTPSMRYRTIVVDPPWPYEEKGLLPLQAAWGKTSFLPYPTMSVAEITALPVRDISLADFGGPDRKPRRESGLPTHEGSHLFLWTTTRFLTTAHEIARAWSFKPTAVLVWCKHHGGPSMGGTFAANVEFVIYARRGAPETLATVPTRWFTWPRGEHSQKPEAFLDMVEQICPGPYLELFARRQRLGWDTWGNEALEHVEISA